MFALILCMKIRFNCPFVCKSGRDVEIFLVFTFFTAMDCAHDLLLVRARHSMPARQRTTPNPSLIPNRFRGVHWHTTYLARAGPMPTMLTRASPFSRSDGVSLMQCMGIWRVHGCKHAHISIVTDARPVDGAGGGELSLGGVFVVELVEGVA